MKKLLVISSYPQQNSTHGDGTVGVASYTKLLLEEMKRLQPDLEIKVLAEILDKNTHYIDNHISVDRIWKRNNLFSLVNLFNNILQDPNQQLFISFEAFMFGSPLHAGLALILFWLLKLKGKHITLAMHQVMGDFRELQSQYWKAIVLNWNKLFFYRLISTTVHTIIVFEEQLKKQLGNKDAVVIPHFIANPSPIDQKKARQRLGWSSLDTYILYFGFIAPYKGIDQLVTIWQKTKHIHLVIAGGINPNYAHNKPMTSFVEHVTDIAEEKNIAVTGYIDENDIPLYFSAADVIIFPYRTFLGSSGPLALALGYEKPVLISKVLQNYKNTADFAAALQEAKLNIEQLTFSMDANTLQKQLQEVKNHQQLIEFTKIIKDKRSIDKIARLYIRTIFS